MAEYRAYLQRGETRLSTFQRVAGAFLGGAGLLTLLPVLFRDTFSDLYSKLLFLEATDTPPASSFERWLLAIPVSLSLLMPLVALFFLVRDLVEFYFTGHHFRSNRDSNATTYPRFILSGILAAVNNQEITKARNDPSVIELLVPKAQVVRERLLKEAEVLGESDGVDLGRFRNMNKKDQDEWLKKFLYNYTASTPRSLALESAKMEASLARHHVLLRILVLRYAKAFLLTILTMCTTILGVVVLDLLDPSTWRILTTGQNPSIAPPFVWCAFISICASWCFSAAWVVRRPVVWIYHQYGDRNAKMETPQSLVMFEQLTLGAALMGVLATAISLWLYVVKFSEPLIQWLAALITIVAIIPTVVYVIRIRVQTTRP